MSSGDCDFNKRLCIICQNDASKLRSSLMSNPDGENNLRAAANKKEDIVLKRINIADNEGVHFYYHVTTTCYKSYCHKQKLADVEKKRKKSNEKDEESSETCV